MSNNYSRARTMEIRSIVIRALVAAVLTVGLAVFLIPAATMLDVLLSAGMAVVVSVTSRPSSSR